MSVNGYADTSVADIIRGAGVSRHTFYELFSSKQDCFVASYARRQGALIARIVEGLPDGARMDRFALLLRAYLSIIASDPGRSRLYLVSVYAAGPEAIARRLELQQEFADGVAGVVGAQSDQDGFNCWTLVAAVSMMVTNALLSDNADAVRDLYDPVLAMAHRLLPPEGAE